MSAPGAGNLQGFPTNSAPVVDKNNDLRWTQPWLQFMISLWRRTGTAQGGSVIPTGMIMPFGMTVPPAGWIVCDGSDVDRTIYAALFSVIGTIWGPGDGINTFTIPDMGNRFAVGNGTLTIGNHTGNIPLTGGAGNGYAVICWMIKT
jgi:hypothetical protein